MMRSLWPLAIATLLVGCYDSTGPYNPQGPEGSYTATTFTVTTSNGVIDEIADGVRVEITLKQDGTTEGFISSSGGEVSLAGTWNTTLGTLHLDNETATFLEMLPFQVLQDRLVGDGPINGVGFHLILTKN
jgi:hypothetical protein